MKNFIFFILIFYIFGIAAPAGAVDFNAADFHSDKFYLAGLAIGDEGFASQWHLEKIQAPDAWEITQGSRNVIVAVIDTGIDLDHPDLINNIWVNTEEIDGNGIDDDGNGYIDDLNGWNFVDKNNIPSPNLNKEYTKTAVIHGTVISGIIAAEGNNAFAGSGVAWHTRIMPLKAFNEMGESDTVLVESALQYAIDNRADIINMSFVGLAYTAGLEKKIKEAYDAGILLVAAAGRENGAKEAIDLDKTKEYPVCYDGQNGENWVLGVAAIDKEDKKTIFSNYGKSCVDIAAPGSGIYSTFFKDSSAFEFNKYFSGAVNGTSVAAPQVAGVAALIKALHPNYTNLELTRVLLASVDNTDKANPYYLGRLGSGRINAYKAVTAAAISMETAEEARVKYVVSSVAGGEPKIWLLDSKGSELKNFYAFSPGFRGGVNLAVGDIDDDGMAEIVVGAGIGGGPQIRIFNLSGKLESQFFAFDKARRNGVLTAIGDTDGDGKNEIIAVEAGKAKPVARVLDKNGAVLKDNLVIFNKYYTNGIGLAVGDVNFDGKDEIIGGAPQGIAGALNIIDEDGTQVGSFFPFGAEFYGGINVSAGDLNDDGWVDIIAGKKSKSPAIRTFDYAGRLLSPEFSAYDKYKYGANISVGDQNKDGNFEILTMTAGGRGAEARVWDGDFNLKISFYPFGKTFAKGLNAFIVTR